MAQSNINLKVEIDSRSVEKAIKQVEKLEEMLTKTLGDLKEIKMGISVVEVKKHWWQFWK